MRQIGSTYALRLADRAPDGESYYSKSKALREARKAKRASRGDVWIINEQTGEIAWASWWVW